MGVPTGRPGRLGADGDSAPQLAPRTCANTSWCRMRPHGLAPESAPQSQPFGQVAPGGSVLHRATRAIGRASHPHPGRTLVQLKRLGVSLLIHPGHLPEAAMHAPAHFTLCRSTKPTGCSTRACWCRPRTQPAQRDGAAWACALDFSPPGDGGARQSHRTRGLVETRRPLALQFPPCPRPRFHRSPGHRKRPHPPRQAAAPRAMWICSMHPA